MITQSIETLNSPKAIIDYAKESGVINLAGNHSAQHCDPNLEKLLQKNILPFANLSSHKFGLHELREAIANKTARLYDHKYNPNTDVSVTAGVRQSVFATILALVKEGDEVLIFEPSHKSYEAAINIIGARAVFVTLKAPEYNVNWEDVQKLITANTKMIIINSPHFPTGSTLSELDMIRLQKIINGTNIVILSDESFEHIVFDNEMHQSIALYPKLRERSVIVSSFNESLNIPNWHIGYCLSVPKFMEKIRKVIDIVGEGINLPYQKAVAEYIKEFKDYNGMSSVYQKKRDLFVKVLEDSKVKVIPSRGTYFQLISLEDVYDENDVELGLKLMKEKDIAAMPISFYYHQKSKRKHLRINLSLPDDVLIEVATRLSNL
ncbi:aminotransferase class I/II-fold pyridoxal phosphate-dependent enzyme [Labilibacter sediminis]|nr:aminotransferase class I/II-fold pyridoxal phosphate-dependent enzyme [Labilibacter sediminis]